MRYINILALALLASAQLSAQETLNIKQCREMALQNNKQINASDKKIAIADLQIKSMKGNFLPDISVMGNAHFSTMKGDLSDRIKIGDMTQMLNTFLTMSGLPMTIPAPDLTYNLHQLYQAGVIVKQPIYMGGKITAGYKMYQLKKEALLASHSLTESEVIVQTDDAYAKLVKASELEKVAKQYNELLLELQRNVQSAVKHGMATQNDLLKVKVKLNESELQMRKAQNGIRLATMNLCHYIGKPLTSEIKVVSEYPTVNYQPSNTQDISARPEYQMLSKKVEVAQQNVKLVRSELLPKVSVIGTANYFYGGEFSNKTILDNKALGGLVNVTIPIFHFGERINKLKAAKLEYEQAQIEQNDLNEKMTLELAQCANKLDEAKLEAELADKSLEQAAENMRMSKKSYDVGMETLSNYLEAQTLWQKAYETKVESYFQLYLNYIAYQKAQGTLTNN